MDHRQKINDDHQWYFARGSFAGEHWLVLGAGALDMGQTRPSKRAVGRVVSSAVEASLVARAASGRSRVAESMRKLAGRRTLLSRLQCATDRR